MPNVVLDNRVYLGSSAATWAELAARAEGRGLLTKAVSLPGPVAVVASSVEAAFEAVALMARFNLDGLLLGRDRFSDTTNAMLTSHGYSVVEYPGREVVAASDQPRPGHGRVGLLTSGSTGAPKLVHHSWATLFSGERCTLARRRWLVPYQVGTYAWYQLITMGLFRSGQDLVPIAAPSGAAFVRTAIEFEVDSVSSTPTMWRLALFEVGEAEIKKLPLKQITLGGEVVDQPLLDRLRKLFPGAKLTHIYASSEAGACIVVHDGMAGFPSEILDKSDPAGPALAIRDGHLWVRSPYSACAADARPADWLDTGDLVEVRGRRVAFLGRADSRLISIGGAKIFVGDIEAAVLQHPSIAWCRVRAVSAPLVGSLAEAEVVAKPGSGSPSDAELEAHCRVRLPESGIPRFWNRLESIPIEASLKSQR